MSEITDLSTSPNELMLKALESPRGIRIWFDHERDAHNCRFACYKQRDADRSRARRLSGDDPMYGRSLFDPLQFSIGSETQHRPSFRIRWYLRLTHLFINPTEIEEL